MGLKDISMDDIQVGDTASFDRTLTEGDVHSFAQLSGDMNPLHMDETYARTTKFGRRVVHGMLLGSLCSRLVGMYLPGKRCVYLGQTLTFKKPVFIGDTVSISGEVMAKSISTGIVEIAISITKDDEEMVEGNAVVQILSTYD